MLGPVWAGRIVSESEPTRRLSPVTYAFAASLIGLLLATAPILATRTNYLQFNQATALTVKHVAGDHIGKQKTASGQQHYHLGMARRETK